MVIYLVSWLAPRELPAKNERIERTDRERSVGWLAGSGEHTTYFTTFDLDTKTD